MTKDLSLKKINEWRETMIGGDPEIGAIVSELMERPIVKESNDYMMAEYAFISSYLWRSGRTEEGKAYIQKALSYAEYALDKKSLIEVYIIAGNYEYLVDNYTQAGHWYFKALELSERIDYERELGRLYNNIGALFVNNKDYEMSLECYMLSEKYAKQEKDKRVLPTLYDNIAELYLVSGQYNEGKHYIKIAERYAKEDDSPIRALNHNINKWRYALHEQDENACEEYYQLIGELLKEMPYGNDYILGVLASFDALVAMNRPSEAVDNIVNAIGLLEKVDDHQNLKKFYYHLIDYYDKTGNREERSKYIDALYKSDVILQESIYSSRLKDLQSYSQTYKKWKTELREKEKTVVELNVENVQLQAVNNNLRSIHDIGISILSTTEFEEIFHILFSRVNELFEIDEFVIATMADSNDHLVFSYASHDDEFKILKKELPLTNNESLTVKCFANNKEIVIHDLEREFPELYDTYSKKGTNLSSLMYLPIVVNGRPFGVLSIQHRQRNVFTSIHVEVFRLLATFASVSFKNAKQLSRLTGEVNKRRVIQEELESINEKLDYLAHYDVLTDVHNRRTFEKKYKACFQDALKSQQPLTVIILDIDCFKQYNDYYGHLMGDNCIIAVAEELRTTLKRPQDFVARYGGDEFVIILPDTDRIVGEAISKALVESVACLKIPHEKSTVSNKVTISLGAVSGIVIKKLTSSHMLTIADQALYKVKRDMGRNAYWCESI